MARPEGELAVTSTIATDPHLAMECIAEAINGRSCSFHNSVISRPRNSRPNKSQINVPANLNVVEEPSLYSSMKVSGKMLAMLVGSISKRRGAIRDPRISFQYEYKVFDVVVSTNNRLLSANPINFLFCRPVSFERSACLFL